MSKTVERSNMTQTVSGKVTREAKKETNELAKYYWWKKVDLKSDEMDSELGKEIAATLMYLTHHQKGRVEQLTVGTRLYGNSNAYSGIGASFGRVGATASPSASRISFNLCASIIDTLTAQMAKLKIVPTFITSGGVWGMQRKAENLNKFIEGAFYEDKTQTKGTYQTRDASIWGDGILYVYRNDEDRAATERVLPHELLVDLVESVVGPARQIHRVKICDRAVAAALFPDAEAEIMAAQPANYKDLGADGSASDLITLSESWHLKSGKKAKDGFRVITLIDSAKVLIKEEWNKKYFPFVILPYKKRPMGFWGQGACERLQSLQGEINRLMITVQKAMWMGAGFKILSHVTDRVPTQHFTNEITSIIKWSGNIKPEYIAPTFIQGEISPYIDGLVAKGYQQEGVSQMSASNVKPIGVNSGTALRTYDQIAEDRQLFFSQSVEESRLEVARQMIEVIKDVYKEKGSYKVSFPNTNFLESVDWADINLNMDEYWLKQFPTSELPEEPMDKLETVQEYAQAGFISPRAARRLLSMPDVEMSDKLANAAEELICKSIEDILYDGKDVRPDSEWDLQLAQSLSLQYMNYAKLNNCPEARLQKLRRFMGYVNDALGLTQPPPPQPQATNVVPMANPQPTPTSALIPNVANQQGQAA